MLGGLPEGFSVDPSLAKGPGSKDYKPDLDKAGKIRVIKDGPLLVEVPVRIIDTDGSIVGEGDRFVFNYSIASLVRLVGRYFLIILVF